MTKPLPKSEQVIKSLFNFPKCIATPKPHAFSLKLHDDAVMKKVVFVPQKMTHDVCLAIMKFINNSSLPLLQEVKSLIKAEVNIESIIMSKDVFTDEVVAYLDKEMGWPVILNQLFLAFISKLTRHAEKLGATTPGSSGHTDDDNLMEVWMKCQTFAIQRIIQEDYPTVIPADVYRSWATITEITPAEAEADPQ